MSTDYTDLAVRTAEDIGSRKNVAGVLVIIIGDDGDTGSALQSPGIALDAFIAISVQMLGLLRADTLNDGDTEGENRPREG